jgi:hypothetical protein
VQEAEGYHDYTREKQECRAKARVPSDAGCHDLANTRTDPDRGRDGSQGLD